MAENEHIGHVVQVIGPVVDVEFQEHHLPEIYNAVRIVSEGFDVIRADRRRSPRCSSTWAKGACAPWP